jgi:hypothetical protein
MAAAITGNVTATVGSKRVPDSGFYADKADDAQLLLNAIFRESGTTADKCDLRYVKRLTFASTTAQTIDLTAAVGDDGVTNNFVEVVVMAIRVRSTTAAASLTIDNAGATNPFVGFVNSAGTLKVYPSTVDSDASSIKNSGFLVLVAPGDPAAAVNASTAKNVRLLPSAHAFDADIVILGRSA